MTPGVRRTAAVLGVLALLASAGCAGFGDVDRPTYEVPGTADTTATRTTATTATATPTTATTATTTRRPTVAPGVGPEGVRDPTALVGAHTDVLSERSFRSRRNLTVRYPNGTVVYARSVAVWRAANGTRYLVNVGVRQWPRFGVDRTAASLYSAGADRPVFERSERSTDPGPRYRVRRLGGENPLVVVLRRLTSEVLVDAVPDPRFDGRLFGLLLAVEGASVTPLSPDGSETTDDRDDGDGDPPPRRYRLRARSVAAGLLPIPEYVDDPRNVSLGAVVDERGAVRRIAVAYTATYRNRSVSVVESVRFDGLGTTAVREPAWVRTARNATGGADGRLDRPKEGPTRRMPGRPPEYRPDPGDVGTPPLTPARRAPGDEARRRHSMAGGRREDTGSDAPGRRGWADGSGAGQMTRFWR